MMGNQIKIQRSDPLYNEILHLLSLGHEGGYWDFKSDYPETHAEKLHDIICMANNLENRNAYLIYGADDDGNVSGIENTKFSSRLDTKSLVEFLRTKNFAGGHVPRVDVKTMETQGHDLDIVTIYNSSFTPFYLGEDFGKDYDLKKRLRAGNIYVRTENINTPMDKTAGFGHTEYLWRKRFGLDVTPFERFKLLLHDLDNWSDVKWGTQNHSYHKLHPEYQIVQGDSCESYEQLRFFYDNERMFYSPLYLRYLSTTLYETNFYFMDEGRCVIPQPQRKALFGKFLYYFFLLNSIDGHILFQLTNGKCVCCNRSGLKMPVLVFADEDEQRAFEAYADDQNLMARAKDIVSKDILYQHVISKEKNDGVPS